MGIAKRASGLGQTVRDPLVLDLGQFHSLLIKASPFVRKIYLNTP
jgi:hypothetical protein